MVVKIRCFPATYLEAHDIVKPSMKKKKKKKKKNIGGWHDSDSQ